MTCLLQRQNELLLLLGLHTAEHAVACQRTLHLGFGFQRSGIDVAIGALHPHLFSDAGNGAWIIAADDKHGHALVFEIGVVSADDPVNSTIRARSPNQRRVIAN